MIFWAYEFHCALGLYKMGEALNEKGPWEWRERDCAWYRDFLQCNPQEGVRLCIYAVKPPEGPVYRCLVEISSDSITRSFIDPLLRNILKEISEIDLKDVEGTEWPFD